MVLQLAGRGGVSVSPELRRRIEAKIAKMQRLLPKLIEARVVLATERHRHLAEVTLQAKGATLPRGGRGARLPRGRRPGARRPGRADPPEEGACHGQEATPGADPPRQRGPGPEALRSPADETPSGRRCVRRTNAKPMSLEEAVDQLRLQTDGLLVFRNARTGAVNVLRRRADRNGGACRARRLEPPTPRPEAGRPAAPDHHHRSVRGREELGHQVLRGHGLLLRGQPADHADPDVRRALRALDPPHRPHRARRRHPGARVPALGGRGAGRAARRRVI